MARGISHSPQICRFCGRWRSDCDTQRILGGIEFVDVIAAIETGSYHESDSNGPAFREAAETATAEALRRAEPVLLEAIVAITTSLPEEFTGVVHGLAGSHEAVIQNIASQERIVSLTANLAASKISTFMSEVSKATQCAARFSLRIVNFVESTSRRGPQDEWTALT